MKKISKEFKKFITRGNILDMAVGIIVGGAFTAIVTSLSNNILKPVINWLLTLILGKNSLTEVYTFLVKSYDQNGILDLTQSIYIDWGTFINSIINFLLIAMILFFVVKTINSFKEGNNKIISELKENTLTRKDCKEMKKLGKNYYNSTDVKEYLENKKAKRLALEEEMKKKKAEEEAAAKLLNPTTQDLLIEIRDLLKKQDN